MGWLLGVSAAYATLHFGFSNIRGMLAAGIPDDATYYFKAAQYLAAGKGFTFDGIHQTNGFHPLWLLVLWPLYRFVPGSPEMLLRLSLVLQIALLAAATLILFRVHRAFFSRRVGLVSLVLFLSLLYFRAINGMESALLVLMLALCFYVAWRGAPFSTDRAMASFGFGLTLGLVTLARLDMIFLPLIVCAVLAARAVTAGPARPTAWRRLLVTAAGFMALLGPYLLYNQVAHGGLMPISGALKSSFPHLKALRQILADMREFAVHTILAGVAGAYLALYGARSVLGRQPEDGREFHRGAMAIMAGAVVLHFAYTMLFMKWAIFGWYFIPYAALIPLLVSEAVQRALAWRVMSGAGGLGYWAAISLLVVVGGIRVHRINFWPVDSSWHVAAYDAAQWVRAHTAADAVMAMADAGHLSYFSGRSVINLDGIANNRELQVVIRSGRLGEYLKANRVQYLAQYQFWSMPAVSSGAYDSVTIRYPGYLYDCMSDPIVLRKADEVYRSRPYREKPWLPPTSLVIWRIPESGRTATGGSEASTFIATPTRTRPRSE